MLLDKSNTIPINVSWELKLINELSLPNNIISKKVRKITHQITRKNVNRKREETDQVSKESVKLSKFYLKLETKSVKVMIASELF